MTQTKIGQDVLKVKNSKLPVEFYSGNKNHKTQVLEILKKSERPLNVKEICELVGIKSWITAKAVAMDLVLSGKVEVFKSGRHFLFRLKR